MVDSLQRYIDPAYRYNFMQGPQEVRSPEDALKGGINCVSLAHLAIRDLFGYELPSKLHCSEMYTDREHFVRVSKDEPLQMGDLFWFGVKNPKIQAEQFEPVYDGNWLINWADFPVKHVAMYTGVEDVSGDPLLLHSTHIEGTNTLWPLSKFEIYRNYRSLYGVSRLIAAVEAQDSKSLVS